MNGRGTNWRYQLDTPRFARDFVEVVRTRRTTVSGVSRELGLAGGSLSRMVHKGHTLHATVTLALAQWAGLNPVDYLIDTDIEGIL